MEVVIMHNSRIIFHIDANSAFLSWEAVYRLQHGSVNDIRDIPSVVGGDPTARHGIVLAKSGPAKRYKIHTGESLYAAKLKCRNLLIVPPRYELYMQCSNAMVKILESYSPVIQRFSIDECFLDMTGADLYKNDAAETAYMIKERIKKELGFTVNIGVSTNKLLAKMASEFEKPDKVHTLFPCEIKSKMFPLSIDNLFMVGRATTSKLHRMGIYTIGELAKCNPDLLKQNLKSYGTLIWDYANGIENSPVRNDGIPLKGLGNSTTLSFDVEDENTAHMVILSLTEMVSMRLRYEKKCCSVISVFVKNHNFECYSHQMKLNIPTDRTDTIYHVSCKLFDEIWGKEPIRQIGIHLSSLCKNDFYQLSLFEPDALKKKALDSAIDKIRMRYGNRSLIRTCFLHSGLNPISGGIVEEDYVNMSSIL